MVILLINNTLDMPLFLTRHGNSQNTLSGSVDALCDLVPFAQFKKRENHPWRSITFSKFADCSLQLY